MHISTFFRALDIVSSCTYSTPLAFSSSKLSAFVSRSFPLYRPYLRRLISSGQHLGHTSCSLKLKANYKDYFANIFSFPSSETKQKLTNMTSALLANCDSCEMRKRNERFLVANSKTKHSFITFGKDIQTIFGLKMLEKPDRKPDGTLIHIHVRIRKYVYCLSCFVFPDKRNKKF